MKFTKQHFRQVADLLRKIEDPEIRQAAIEQNCEMFEKDNPGFDKNRFIQYIETGSDKK